MTEKESTEAQSYDDPWKEQFDLAGSHPYLWYESASHLTICADYLEGLAGDYVGDMMRRRGEAEATLTEDEKIKLNWQWHRRRGADRVSHMLRAMAVEDLLKAMWLYHGGKLISDGKYSGILRGSEHRLHILAKAISEKSGFAFTEREMNLLELASFWIFSGRYPVQKDYQYLVPYERPDGTTAPKQFWKGPVPSEQELKVLAERIRASLDLDRKIRPGSDAL